jgi:curved DNA-binding protein CbpA
MSTYYDVLKTDRSATVADLKEAYRRVQFESHPDKNGHLSERERVSREEMCKLANVAYEVFSDTHARRKYDAALSVGESDSTSPSKGVWPETSSKPFTPDTSMYANLNTNKPWEYWEAFYEVHPYLRCLCLLVESHWITQKNGIDSGISDGLLPHQTKPLLCTWSLRSPHLQLLRNSRHHIPVPMPPNNLRTTISAQQSPPSSRRDIRWNCILSCQPGTSVHRVHVNCISHVTLRHLLTHLGCVYNRSM